MFYKNVRIEFSLYFHHFYDKINNNNQSYRYSFDIIASNIFLSLLTLTNVQDYTWSYSLNNLLKIIWYFNPCPAEPGYTLPLQTV